MLGRRLSDSNHVERFTDFLVFEIDQNYNIVHLESIEKPSREDSVPFPPKSDVLAPIAEATAEAIESGDSAGVPVTEAGMATENQPLLTDELGPPPSLTPHEPQIAASDAPTSEGEGLWPTRFTETLSPFLSPSLVEKLKELYLEGPEPPLTLVPDSGWGSRTPSSLRNEEDLEFKAAKPTSIAVPGLQSSSGSGNSAASVSGRGWGKDRDSGRGGRGGRGGGPGDGNLGRRVKKEDTRKVVSDVSTSIIPFNNILLRSETLDE